MDKQEQTIPTLLETDILREMDHRPFPRSPYATDWLSVYGHARSECRPEGMTLEQADAHTAQVLAEMREKGWVENNGPNGWWIITDAGEQAFERGAMQYREQYEWWHRRQKEREQTA